jgi:tetratricopeptide (TPR) repeat protein
LNKDNVLFATLGILLGFIAGYLLHEVMAARQPTRLRPGESLAVQQQGPGQSAAGQSAPGQPAPAGPSPEELRQLEEFVAQNPDNAQAVLALANVSFDSRNWPRATELYGRFLEIQPSNPDVLTDYGVALHETGRHAEALEKFREAQEIAPQHWQSRYNEVIVLAFGMSRFDEAAKVLEDLKRIQPNNPNIVQLEEAIARQRGAA